MAKKDTRQRRRQFCLSVRPSNPSLATYFPRQPDALGWFAAKLRARGNYLPSDRLLLNWKLILMCSLPPPSVYPGNCLLCGSLTYNVCNILRLLIHVFVFLTLPICSTIQSILFLLATPSFPLVQTSYVSEGTLCLRVRSRNGEGQVKLGQAVAVSTLSLTTALTLATTASCPYVLWREEVMAYGGGLVTSCIPRSVMPMEIWTSKNNINN